MAEVITEGSIIKCAHQGTVQFVASQHKLTVNGKAVLVKADVKTGVVSNCQTKPSTSPPAKPCTKIVSLTAGAATKLSVGEIPIPVLLETATGLTDGVVGTIVGTWSVEPAGQTKLDAV